MEEALVALLLANAAIAGVVATRITWVKRVQGAALPAMVLHRIAGAGVGDVMGGHDGLAFALVQIDHWAASYGAAKTLARMTRAVLAAPTNPAFTGLFVQAERDDVDAAQAGQPDVYRTSLDVRVWFLEP